MLRRMALEDVRWASPLAEQAFSPIDPGYGDAVAAWIADPACTGWVAESDSGPSGFALIGGIGVGGRSHVLELLAIVVDAQVRRNGVGRHLLAAVLREARRRSVRHVWLNVARSNAPAIALFEQGGFRIDRVDDGDFANGERALRLVWRPGGSGRE